MHLIIISNSFDIWQTCAWKQYLVTFTTMDLFMKILNFFSQMTIFWNNRNLNSHISQTQLHIALKFSGFSILLTTVKWQKTECRNHKNHKKDYRKFAFSGVGLIVSVLDQLANTPVTLVTEQRERPMDTVASVSVPDRGLFNLLWFSLKCSPFFPKQTLVHNDLHLIILKLLQLNKNSPFRLNGQNQCYHIESLNWIKPCWCFISR